MFRFDTPPQHTWATTGALGFVKNNGSGDNGGSGGGGAGGGNGNNDYV
jgi:hypothetical protein